MHAGDFATVEREVEPGSNPDFQHATTRIAPAAKRGRAAEASCFPPVVG